MASRPVALLAVLAVLLIPAALARVHADDPVGTSITFNREIIRIVQRKCEPCHALRGLAMSLSDYRDARAWGRAIREELIEHRMPPAILARGYGDYESDPSLNAREMATFLTWLDGGMPRGDEADRPARRPGPDLAADAGDPDAVRIPLPTQTVPAGQDLVIRRVTVDAGRVAGRTIARVQVRPGNPRVLRGALVFASSSSDSSSSASRTWVGAWLPWQHAVVPPPAAAFAMPAQAALVVELYYRGADAAQTDGSVLELTFGAADATGRVGDVVVETTAQTATGYRGRVQIPRGMRVWAIQPALDASVTSLELRVERPDQSIEILLWVPAVRPEWPLALAMREPVVMPAGSVVSFVAARHASRTGTPPRVTLSVLP